MTFADYLPGNAYSMHPAANANFIDTPNRIANTVVVEINPVLQMGLMTVTCMMDCFIRMFVRWWWTGCCLADFTLLALSEDV